MLKIYLDWNCITHSKNEDEFSFIHDLAKNYGDLFIFPYSTAHIRDLMVSRNPLNFEFENDIKLLTQICGNHLLVFEDEQVQPKFCYPNDYIALAGNIIEAIQKTEFISPKTYNVAKDNFRRLIPNDVFKKIQGAEPKDAIKIINKYIKSFAPEQDIAKLMTDSVSKLSELMTAEAKFKCICLGLDLFGFRPEKKNKSFTNIDTDASHIFYSSFCNYLVTNDKKLAAKAEAIYTAYNIQTKILSPYELENTIYDERSKEYSIEYMLSCINTYGIPKIQEDGAHYKLMNTPVFGLFDVVHKIDEYWDYDGNSICGLFRYSFQNIPYLYFTELEHFFEFFESICSPDLKEAYFKNYVEPMKSRNKETTSKAHFELNCPDLNLQINLMYDSMAFVPCPMMQVLMGNNTLDNIKLLKKQLIAKEGSIK